MRNRLKGMLEKAAHWQKKALEKRDEAKAYLLKQSWFLQILEWYRPLKMRFDAFREANPRTAKALGYGSTAFSIVFLPLLLLYLYVLLFGNIPSKTALRDWENNQASEVYSADSVLLGRFFFQERTNVRYEDISPNIIQALIATEDIRFYEHSGIDYQSFARVFFKSLLLQDESAGGGSTLSQQLAKNLFGRKLNYGYFSLAISKIREMIIARRLEKVYTKEELLTFYLNTVPFGDNAYGIEMAAQRFFSKKPNELSIEEAAVLVGMLKANNAYNPRINLKRSRDRRNVVIAQMEKYGFITKAVADSAKASELDTSRYQRLSHSEGLAPYFREYLRQEVQEMLKNQTKANGQPYNVHTDGLKIYTTIDSKMQAYAEKAVAEKVAELQALYNQHWKGSEEPWAKNAELIPYLVKQTERYQELEKQGFSEEKILEIFNKPEEMMIFSWENGEESKTMSPLDSVKYYLNFLHSGMMSMDPETGDVKVWIGGINHEHFKYDHVNIKTKRQVGSTFKPFVYAAALENGLEPCLYLSNSAKSYKVKEGYWTPRNSDGLYDGYYSMQGALVNSINTVTVRLIDTVGIDKTIALAKRAGILSRLDTLPAVALGAASISLYEMVGAYSAFINKGEYVQPRHILRIEDSEGKVLYKAPEPKRNIVMLPDNAAMLLQMMRNVVNRGTAGSLRYQFSLYQSDIAGKTGTTQNQTDGWFIGMTPKLITGVWIGGEYPEIRFRTMNLGQGSRTALPVWGRFFQLMDQDTTLWPVTRAKFPYISGNLYGLMDCPDFRESMSDSTNVMEQLMESLLGTSEERQERREEKQERKEERKEEREAKREAKKDQKKNP